MKKVLLINGSPNENGCTALALEEVAAALKRRGIECETRNIGKKPVAGCIACGSCRKTGKCIFNDAVNEILASADEYAALVVGSPVYYAGASGQICALLDRLF
ncbi:MAG: flavodoxin family protein, partial [Opitutales bacterium]|nr:flavodoxin family protein [Opitutales bacterium]